MSGFVSQIKNQVQTALDWNVKWEHCSVVEYSSTMLKGLSLSLSTTHTPSPNKRINKNKRKEKEAT
jgi:hypothetical protein